MDSFARDLLVSLGKSARELHVRSPIPSGGLMIDGSELTRNGVQYGLAAFQQPLKDASEQCRSNMVHSQVGSSRRSCRPSFWRAVRPGPTTPPHPGSCCCSPAQRKTHRACGSQLPCQCLKHASLDSGTGHTPLAVALELVPCLQVGQFAKGVRSWSGALVVSTQQQVEAAAEGDAALQVRAPGAGLQSQQGYLGYLGYSGYVGYAGYVASIG
jgi:hypothetical protein